MADYMEKNRDKMPDSNEKGLERVISADKKYAFLMESSSIQYITERQCNLTQVGDKLDDKNYGIGMRKSEF